MIITQTPLRLSLLGGNTDFPEYFLKFGGLVLSTTIDKYIYCIVKERFDDLIIVNYTVKETVEKVDDLKHELVRESLKLLGINKGLEISFLGDIPSRGTGLGSSSAVTVGVLNALHTYLRENVSSSQLAQEAVKIELDILKRPIGIQDQYAVSVGSLRVYEFAKSGDVYNREVILPDSVREDFDNSMMLLYTGITRKSSDVLSSIHIAKNKKLLDKNKALAKNGEKALLKGNIKRFGQLLNEYWELKKTLSKKVSNEKIERMYQRALKAGAIGGKVVGAGGGGFLLIVFPANRRAIIRSALKDHKELLFRLNGGGSRVILNIN